MSASALRDVLGKVWKHLNEAFSLHNLSRVIGLATVREAAARSLMLRRARAGPALGAGPVLPAVLAEVLAALLREHVRPQRRDARTCKRAHGRPRNTPCAERTTIFTTYIITGWKMRLHHQSVGFRFKPTLLQGQLNTIDSRELWAAVLPTTVLPRGRCGTPERGPTKIFF